MNSATTTDAHALLWNERGEIGCTRHGHAPMHGSDMWRIQGWRGLRFADRVALAAEFGHQPRCETCAADARSASFEERAP